MLLTELHVKHGWVQKHSKSRNRPYYVHKPTGKRVWELPCIPVDQEKETEVTMEPSETDVEHDKTVPDVKTSKSCVASFVPGYIQDGKDVGRHYDQVCEMAHGKRRSEHCSQALFARHLNTWVKSVVLRATLSTLARVHPQRSAPLSFLDLACGRGGDIGRIVRTSAELSLHLRAYVGIDVSPASVQEACTRATKVLPDAVIRKFLVCDLTDTGVMERIEKASHGTAYASEVCGPGQYRVVWMAFALHYFFASACHLHGLLTCVQRALAPGGMFVASFIDGNRIVRLARVASTHLEVPEDARRPVHELVAEGKEDPWFEFTGPLWRVRMPWRTMLSANEGAVPYTLRYRFWIPAHCEDPSEYLVNGDLAEEYLPVDELLVTEAQQRGLRLVFESTHKDLIPCALRTSQGLHLAKHMKISRNAVKVAEIHADDMDLASLYKTMVFASCNTTPALWNNHEEARRVTQLCRAPRGSQPCDALGIGIAYDLGIGAKKALPYSVPFVDSNEA